MKTISIKQVAAEHNIPAHTIQCAAVARRIDRAGRGLLLNNPRLEAFILNHRPSPNKARGARIHKPHDRSWFVADRIPSVPRPVYCNYAVVFQNETGNHLYR